MTVREVVVGLFAVGAGFWTLAAYQMPALWWVAALAWLGAYVAWRCVP